MKLVLETLHGNSKATNNGYYWGRQITIASKDGYSNCEDFAELYKFFTESLGPSTDIDTQLILNPSTASWTYQLDPKGGQHRFFVKERADLDWFLLKYSDKLTRWSR